MKSKSITVTLIGLTVLLIGFGIGQIYGVPKAKPKYNCMRMYYAQLDIEFCGPTIECTFTEDGTGSNKICRDVRNDK